MKNLLQDRYAISQLDSESDQDVQDYRNISIEAARSERSNLVITAQELESEPIESTIHLLQKNIILGVRSLLDDRNSLIATGSLKSIPIDKRKHFGEVGSMFVYPEHRGNGLGKELLSHIIDHAYVQKILGLELYVTTHNANAIKLYEQFDFKKHGILPRALKVDDAFYDGQYMVRMLQDI